jgi:hypothetical protein
MCGLYTSEEFPIDENPAIIDAVPPATTATALPPAPDAKRPRGRPPKNAITAQNSASVAHAESETPPEPPPEETPDVEYAPATIFDFNNAEHREILSTCCVEMGLDVNWRTKNKVAVREFFTQKRFYAEKSSIQDGLIQFTGAAK